MSGDITTERSLSTFSLDGTSNTDITNTINKLAASFKILNENQQSCVATFDTISQQMNELQSLSIKVNEHDTRIHTIEKENKLMKSTIKSLTRRLDTIDQRYSNDKLQLAQIPYTEGENLYDIVVNIGTKMNIPVNKDDVIDAFRPRQNTKDGGPHNSVEEPQGSSASSDPVQSSSHGKKVQNVVVKFRSQTMRDNILNSYRNKYKKLGLYLDNDKKQKIFINEYLSSNTSRLLYKTKLFSKANNYKYVWTRNGNIYLRKGDGTKIISVDCLTDFSSIDDSGAAGQVHSQ